MNIYQRIILVVGVIVFVIVLLTAPRITFFKGTLRKVSSSSHHASIMDIGAAAVRGLAVLGATALLWFATKGINPKKED